LWYYVKIRRKNENEQDLIVLSRQNLLNLLHLCLILENRQGSIRIERHV
jgi:hypothetical protein